MQPLGFTDGFALTFEDHFDGGALNTGSWNYREDGPSGTLRSEQVPGNVTVGGGVNDSLLHIAGSKSGANYFGGGIESVVNTHKYGYFEARVKISAPRGWHQTFWMFHASHVDANYLEEIDIAESFSATVTTSIAQALHLVPSVHHNRSVAGDFTTAFHVFGALHTAGVVHFYYDGQSVGRREYVANESALMILVLSNVSRVEDTMFDEDLPSDMQVDWVRAYSIVGAGPTIGAPQSARAMAVNRSPVGLCQESIIEGQGGALLGTRGATLRGQLVLEQQRSLDIMPPLPTNTTSTQTVSPGVTSATINGFAANTRIRFNPGTYTNLSIVPKDGQWFEGLGVNGVGGRDDVILTSTLSSTRAFSGAAKNVFIQGLTIREYNPGSRARNFTPTPNAIDSEAQKAAIEYTGTANESLPGTAISWTVYQCKLTNNYGRGVNVTNGDWVSQTEISDNAGNGGGGRGFDIKLTDCDIFNNNRWDMSKTWDAAGIKFGGGATPGDTLIPPCKGIKFRRCKIHDNNGHAIWTDWDVFDVEVDHCSIYANAWGAISAEAAATYWVHHCQIGDNLRGAANNWLGSYELNWQSCKKSIVEDNLFACYNNINSDLVYFSQHQRSGDSFQGGVYIGHFTCVENTFRRNVILQRSGASALAEVDFPAGGLCTQNTQACTGVACSQNCGTVETGCELLFEGGVPAGGLGGNVHCFVPASTAAHFNVAENNTWRSGGTPPAFPGGAWGSETGRTTGGTPDSFLPDWSVIPTWTTPPGKL